ncbi:MAG: hypothetical protein EP348_05110 [Alphaproteobacteria bacterium]|nr:MAG: hypothetical protein EP348_05110 [Alphaproteobacteria bacterium]
MIRIRHLSGGSLGALVVDAAREQKAPRGEGRKPARQKEKGNEKSAAPIYSKQVVFLTPALEKKMAAPV